MTPARLWLGASLLALLGLACSEPPSSRPSYPNDGGAAGAAGSDTDGGTGGSSGSTAPERLSESGLYRDLSESEALAPGVVEYRPRFELWSDGAEKRRFVWLPPGGRIDTSDLDYWVFPSGTRVWKEFRRDGVRVETRLLEKTSQNDWTMLAFAWNAEQTDAHAVPRGADDVLGTGHDIPSRVMCGECHDNMPDKLLGFGAVQLSHALGGLTLDELIETGLLTRSPETPIEPPGDDIARAALGYLHANCGNCHNRRSGKFPTVHLELHLEVGSLETVESTTTYRTTVGIPFEGVPPTPEISELRIDPGRPERSALTQRMSSRDLLVQMPPVATELVDEAGLAAVEAWIRALEP